MHNIMYEWPGILLPLSLNSTSQTNKRIYHPCGTVLSWLTDNVMNQYYIDTYGNGSYIRFSNPNELLMFKLVFSEHYN